MLSSIKAPSGSKIKRVAELAVEHSRHYKHVVHAVERLVRKAHSPPQTVAGLYCIDAIVRHSRHSHSSAQPDVYVMRFSQHLAELLLDVVERCGQDGKDAIRKLCNTWKARSVFDAELLSRMLDEVGAAEAEEEGTEEERDRRRREQQQAETDSEDEKDEKKRPEPTVRRTAPPPPRPPTAAIPPPSQLSAQPQHTQHPNGSQYPSPYSAPPLLPTPPQPANAYAWQQQQQHQPQQQQQQQYPYQAAYQPPPAPTHAPVGGAPSYAAFLGGDDDDDDADNGGDDRLHRMRQRLEAEKLKLSQPPPAAQPPPQAMPPPQPQPQPPPIQPPAAMNGQGGYEYEQKRSRFGAPKSRDEVQAAMATQNGPVDVYREQHQQPPATDHNRSSPTSSSPPVYQPPTAAPAPPPQSYDARPPPRQFQHNSPHHPGLQLSSDQSNCPPGLARVLTTVLFIGHGKLETSSTSLTDWSSTLTALCQPHVQLVAMRYVANAGAHFATFATRGQAEAAVVAMQRQRVLDRELRLGWGKSKGMDIQQFDSDAGDGLVDAREAEMARLEVWPARAKSVAELMREQTEQRTRSNSSNGAERGSPTTAQSPSGFSSPQHYQSSPQATPASQPFSPSSAAGSARPSFHYLSRPPPVYEPPPSAAPSPKPGPSPSVAAFLASVLPPATPSAAAHSYAPPPSAPQANYANPPQQQQQQYAHPQYPANMPYVPPPSNQQLSYPGVAMPYVPPAVSYPQNGHKGDANGSDVAADPWEARKRMRWDEGQQGYQPQQPQQQQQQQQQQRVYGTQY